MIAGDVEWVVVFWLRPAWDSRSSGIVGDLRSGGWPGREIGPQRGPQFVVFWGLAALVPRHPYASS